MPKKKKKKGVSMATLKKRLMSSIRTGRAKIKWGPSGIQAYDSWNPDDPEMYLEKSMQL